MKVDEKNFSAIDDFLSKRGIRKSMNVDDKLVLYVEKKLVELLIPSEIFRLLSIVIILVIMRLK